ncbi:hypothetical protein J6590_012893 [Homalodisca vitripennis]|nr:hypothetical protein J6590_012893 [Homalodisca vitripennis]
MAAQPVTSSRGSIIGHKRDDVQTLDRRRARQRVCTRYSENKSGVRHSESYTRRRRSVLPIVDVVNVRDVKHYKPCLNTLVRDLEMLYRFEEERVKWLDRFVGTNEENRGGALSSVHKMCAYVISVILAIKKVSVKNLMPAVVILVITDDIVELSNEWIKCPTTNLEITEAKQLW